MKLLLRTILFFIFIILVGSCKTSQSEKNKKLYRSENNKFNIIYKDIDGSLVAVRPNTGTGKRPQTAAIPTETTVTTPTQEVAEQPEVLTVTHSDIVEDVIVKQDDKKVFRKDKFTLMDAADAPYLKKYNVVIATLSKSAGVDRIKSAFAAEGSTDRLIVVKNDRGLFYVIKGSYDNKNDASFSRNQVINNYAKVYSRKTLMNKYGIPFSDVWIVYNED